MPQRESNQTYLTQFLVLLLLVAAGVALRLYFRYLPNFAPVAALALFAGYYFRSAACALAVPLAVMLISDKIIGGYHWGLMLTVYVMLGLPVVMRALLRRNVDLQSSSTSRLVRSMATVVGCSFVASVLFFIVTNFATWQVTNIYDKSLTGLAACFTQAIPFFRYTLAGDLLFGTALFGGYALALRWMAASETETATASN